MKKADLGIAIYILTAIAMLIVTLPSGILDILLAFNIAGNYRSGNQNCGSISYIFFWRLCLSEVEILGRYENDKTGNKGRV